LGRLLDVKDPAKVFLPESLLWLGVNYEFLHTDTIPLLLVLSSGLIQLHQIPVADWPTFDCFQGFGCGSHFIGWSYDGVSRFHGGFS
jgi:hypothetical protein